jgi:hypothetical protein
MKVERTTNDERGKFSHSVQLVQVRLNFKGKDFGLFLLLLEIKAIHGLGERTRPRTDRSVLDISTIGSNRKARRICQSEGGVSRKGPWMC